jgi:hypothetical protein
VLSRGSTEWYLQHLHDLFVSMLCTGANRGVLGIGGSEECLHGDWLIRGMLALVQPPFPCCHLL